MANLSLLTVVGMVLLAPGATFSQAYPTKPIRLIVPVAAGSASDIAARSLASELSKQMRQQVVVDNRPGAGNIIGLEMIARAAPDGYTVG